MEYYNKIGLSVIFVTGLVVVSGFYLLKEQNTPQNRYSETIRPHAVNAVIGDKSFIETYGRLPDKSTSERKRIVTHLKYVRQKLMQQDISDLTKEQRQKREMNFSRLQKYIAAGKFPVNEAYSDERRPNFMDSKGRICAVGYLIEQSLGHKVVEEIRDKYQYEYVLNINSDILNNWVGENGFTLRELAMIQPMYCYNGCVEYIKEDHNIGKDAEAIIIGSNIGLMVVNGYLGTRKSGKLIPATAGIALGAATITLGMTDQSNYSATDYITGGLSLAAGSWAMVTLFDKKSSSNELTVIPLPDVRYKNNIGLALQYQF